MTAAAAVHPPRDWDGLLQTWKDLDVPEGWRAEIDDGGITTTRRRAVRTTHDPVPLYLLIDRYDPNGPTVTLYSEPSGGGYRRHLAVPFGEPVDLPAPFDVTLDTTRFPTRT